MSSSRTASSDHWLWAHPRALYYLVVLVPVFVWQSVVAVLAFSVVTVFFVLFVQLGNWMLNIITLLAGRRAGIPSGSLGD